MLLAMSFADPNLIEFQTCDYTSQEPMRAMMECFNYVVHLHDFNVATNPFKSRLSRLVLNLFIRILFIKI